MNSTKAQLLQHGRRQMDAWCTVNHIDAPRIVEMTGLPEFGVCAYYRDGVITIWTKHCAPIGMAGRAWSYPGYTVDRTPFGVIAHELAHHVDHAHGPNGGTYGRKWLVETQDKPISGYHGNANEWFAEMFRLFVTNPDLLAWMRPKTYTLMRSQWVPVEHRNWQAVLHGADRQIAVATKRIAAMNR